MYYLIAPLVCVCIYIYIHISLKLFLSNYANACTLHLILDPDLEPNSFFKNLFQIQVLYRSFVLELDPNPEPRSESTMVMPNPTHLHL